MLYSNSATDRRWKLYWHHTQNPTYTNIYGFGHYSHWALITRDISSHKKINLSRVRFSIVEEEKLEQLERLRSERLRSEDTPLPPHDYPYYWVILDPKSKEDTVKVTNLKNLPKFQIVEFLNKHYTQHTFWSCLIRCANMKWIRWVLLKIQSGHDSVHRRTDGWTDGQGETSITPFELRWSGGYNKTSNPPFQLRWRGGGGGGGGV